MERKEGTEGKEGKERKERKEREERKERKKGGQKLKERAKVAVTLEPWKYMGENLER